MKSLYSDSHRDLQVEFGTTKLAEMLDTNWIHDTVTEDEKTYIEGLDMFFLSTVDPEGNPTVSYKGGPTGFVTVIDENTLAFPGYDGNGMFYSMGNIVGQSKVGMLFIDFENPHRLRVQGTATFERDHPLLAKYPEAKYLVVVSVTKVWGNCSRYVHKYQRVGQSKYVPGVCQATPIATWKRMDMVQELLPEEDRAKAQQEGLLTPEQYNERFMEGDG